MWWTTEQVAEHAGMTVEQVYVTRRHKEWPGVLGVRQGRELRFDAEEVQAGPTEPQHTDDPAVAAVWLLDDIRGMVRQIRTAVEEVRAWTAEQEKAAAEDPFGSNTYIFTLDDERADDDDRRAEGTGEGGSHE